MKTNTRQDILALIKKHGQVSPHQLQQELGFGAAAIHRQLRKLEAADSIIKIGAAPRTLYVLRDVRANLPTISSLPDAIAAIIEERYAYVNPDGVILKGVEGFAHWVQKTGEEKQFLSLAKEYVKVRQEADEWYRGQPWIDATSKFSQTFPETEIDQVAYADFYALPKFGKTKLGTYTLHAKVSQNVSLMKLLATETKPIIQSLIKDWNIQAVGYIPHSIPRNRPLLPVIARELALTLPEISVEKVYAGAIRVPQKSLSKLTDRVENAQKTLYVTENVPWQRVMLIDDAVGSGATLSEVAHKLKSQFATTFVAGFAIVGSYKGFEVISEV